MASQTSAKLAGTSNCSAVAETCDDRGASIDREPVEYGYENGLADGQRMSLRERFRQDA